MVFVVGFSVPIKEVGGLVVGFTNFSEDSSQKPPMAPAQEPAPPPPAPEPAPKAKARQSSDRMERDRTFYK